MTNNLDKIVDRLPKGLSKTGLNEIASLIDEVIAEQVEEKITLVEAKVSSFLRGKIQELKEIAEQEYQNDNETYRSKKVYESIKALVAGDLETKDSDSIVKSHEKKINALSEDISTLNSSLEQHAQENSLLESKLTKMTGEFGSLKDKNVLLAHKATLPFKSSEAAVIITNDPDKAQSISESTENGFLTEDVIRLSQPLSHGEN